MNDNIMTKMVSLFVGIFSEWLHKKMWQIWHKSSRLT